MTIPFTYYLYHRPTGKKYYGVRYKKGCKPETLWTTYFSSSKKVKSLIKEYGKDSFDVEVRKIFEDKNKAFLWETNVLRRLKVEDKLDWLNIHANTGRLSKLNDNFTKEHKLNLSISLKGKPKSDAHREKIRNPSQETKDILSASTKRLWQEGVYDPKKTEKTQFKKGGIPWNKGKSGVMPPSWNKGKAGTYNLPSHTEERRKKQSEAMKGNKNGLKKKEEIVINDFI